jgi:hypothetical protein
MPDNILFRVKSFDITWYKIIMTLWFAVLAIWGLNSYVYQKRMMNNKAHTIGRVIYLKPGKRLFSPPHIFYEFTVEGKSREHRQVSQFKSDPAVGDCVEIIYSTQDPDVSEINFEHSPVSCGE